MCMQVVKGTIARIIEKTVSCGDEEPAPHETEYSCVWIFMFEKCPGEKRWKLVVHKRKFLRAQLAVIDFFSSLYSNKEKNVIEQFTRR